MKTFRSIREGNSAEPGVSEIDDVPEDPMSFVEIKPKKTKVVKEGIVDTAANAKVRIFSSIDRKKKELYKNAVKEDIQEAVTVKKEKYSWGKMVTVHDGNKTSYPLHPEHQQAIAKLKDGEKTKFKDETNSTVHAHRDGDTVHLTRPRIDSEGWDRETIITP
jgi:predicted HNH restriction endonuclease